MNANSLRKHGIGLIAALILEFILGMITNLFVAFPENSTENQQWDFAKSHLLVMAHIALGMVLLIGAIVLYVNAYKLHHRVWKIAGGLGLASVLFAIMSGSEFVSKQKDGFSLAMSLFFIAALASFSWGAYQTKSQ